MTNLNEAIEMMKSALPDQAKLASAGEEATVLCTKALRVAALGLAASLSEADEGRRISGSKWYGAKNALHAIETLGRLLDMGQESAYAHCSNTGG